MTPFPMKLPTLSARRVVAALSGAEMDPAVVRHAAWDVLGHAIFRGADIEILPQGSHVVISALSELLALADDEGEKLIEAIARTPWGLVAYTCLALMRGWTPYEIPTPETPS